MYYGDQLVNLVREAHSIALAKYHGPYKMYLDKELTNGDIIKYIKENGMWMYYPLDN